MRAAAILALIQFSTICGFAREIPDNSAIIKGRLSNGLTYYIARNSENGNTANFYLLQRSGALQEEDSQVGLAHFLEHLCFRRTRHFPDHSAVAWCQSLGLRFGTDVNATTQIDNTVYSIERVPTARPSVVDSCLLLLSDWSNGILFDQKIIEEERQVIIEEWRVRRTATSRLLERNLPLLYSDSRYGYRTTIGFVDSLRHSRVKALQQYYHTWYRPENQAVIVIGDINPNKVIEILSRLFTHPATSRHSHRITPFAIPDNPQPIVVTDSDKELSNSYVKLFVKHAGQPASKRNTENGVIDNFIRMAARMMVNRRLAEKSVDPSCPFAKATLSDGNYIYATTQKALQLSVVPSGGETTDTALRCALTEVLRAAKYGFGEQETADFMQSVAQRLSSGDRTDNRQLFEQCRDNFLDGSAMPTNAWVNRLLAERLPDITADSLRLSLSRLLDLSGHNMVIASFCRTAGPSRESLLKAVKEACEARLTPYLYNKPTAGQLTATPAAGTITAETRDTQYGTTTLKLSNGATVVLRHTGSLQQPVILRAEARFGCGNYDTADIPQVKFLNNALLVGGIGQLNATQLRHWLTNRQATAAISMDDQYAHINLTAPAGATDGLLQLAYGCLTSVRNDTAAASRYKARMAPSLRQAMDNPDNAFTDSITRAIYLNGDWLLTMTPDELQQADYGRMMELWQTATADMSGWTFFISGHFDEEGIRKEICQWIASIPSTHKALPSDATGRLRLRPGHVRREFTIKAATPSVAIYRLWHNESLPYTAGRAVQLELAGQMLSTLLLDSLRSASVAYTCNVGYDVTLTLGMPVWSVYVTCTANPDKAKAAQDILDRTVNRLARQADEAAFNEAKAILARKYSQGSRGNSFWDDAVYRHTRFGIDCLADYPALLRVQTAKSVSHFLTSLLKGGTASVVMHCQP